MFCRPGITARGRAITATTTIGLIGVLAVCGPAGVAQAAPAAVCAAGTCTVSFAESGAPEQWTVPGNIASITVTVAGGSGGNSTSGDQGGAGGTVTTTLAVTAGHTLSVVVGAAGANGVFASPNVPAAGGYGGGGAAGSATAVNIDFPAGGGGGGSFIFDTTAAQVLAVAGGGGGSDGIGEPAAGNGGSGTDASLSPFHQSSDGSPGTVNAPGAGSPSIGSGAGGDGTGPATSPTVLGVGGAGNANPGPGYDGTAGGGGGGYTGGGGGTTDTLAIHNGSGGGGSGFLAAGATAITTSTNIGNGSVTLTYPQPTMTTSGVLRDAATGASIPNSCVLLLPAAGAGTVEFSGVHRDGSWSFTTNEPGPFNLAFYTTADGDCSQPILPAPRPSWYVNQPVTGTDPNLITAPAGASTVPAGSTAIVACLGVHALPTAACVTPDTRLSGRVMTSGQKPLPHVCVLALDGHGDGVAATASGTDGTWSMTGLPRSRAMIVAFLPNFGTPGHPCDGGNGPPPVPAAGALQPVFYRNVWINLADPSLLNDAYHWAIAHGATTLTASTQHVDACLITTPGTVTPRPSCTPVALGADDLANSGTPTAALLTTAVALIMTGALTLQLARHRAQPRIPR